MSDDDANDMLELSRQKRPGVLTEYWRFVRSAKKWWLPPIFLVIVLIGVLALFGSGGGAPYVYTLF